MTLYNVRGKTILVTGGTGFIGGSVALHLIENGAKVRVLARNAVKAKAISAQGAEIVQGDMADARSLKEAVRGCQAVFHFAAVLGDEFKPVSYFRRINVEGTRNLALAALDEKIERFVHASTVWVYGVTAKGRVDESSSRVTSGFPYADTKREGEEVIRRFINERGLPAVIVQPTDVYGPGDETYTLEPIRLIRNGGMILAKGGKGLLNMVYIDDLSRGIMLAAEKGVVGQAYILASPSNTTCKTYFEHLARIAGHKKKLPSIPGWIADVAARILELNAMILKSPPLFTREAIYATLIRATYDGSKAYNELGFNPEIGLETGISRVKEWFDAYSAEKRQNIDKNT